jgi:hypothetical protein
LGLIAALQLAQFADVPPSLPSPPFYEKYLLESPAVPVVLLAAAAIAAFFVLNRRGKPAQGALATAGLGLAAAGVAALAHFVTTAREAMTAAAEGLVAAVARADTAELDRLLDPDAMLFADVAASEARIPKLGLPKAGILPLVTSTMQTYRLTSAEVAASQSQVTGTDLGKTQLRAKVVPSAWNIAHNSWWLIEWRRTPTGQWRALTIRLLSLDGVGR